MPRHKFALSLWFLSVFLILVSPACRGQTVFRNYVTVSGDRLMDGDEPLRFVSFNIPNLLLIEDNMRFTETNPWRLPDRYEIDDALRTIRQIGGAVARTYTITVRRADDRPEVPKHVLGPGRFSEQAFRAMDQVLEAAGRLGVRLIIPLVDNWRWMGGRPQYAAFRNKSPEEFWTDEQLRDDFRRTIEFVLNRVNTFTGVAYKDDPAILAWELGNELRGCSAEWAEEMARTIKAIDSNHLVADGVQAASIPRWALASEVIDLVSTHHYESDPQEMVANIQRAAEQARAKKPYYVGEFGFISTGGMEHVLQVIQTNENISGALLWSLRFHNRDGGFYWHSEPMGGGLYRAYHWPGFVSGIAYDETGVTELVRRAAHDIRGEPIAPLRRPDAPVLLPIEDVGHIRWRGATGAACYVVERAEAPDCSWQVAARQISDAADAYVSLFSDRGAQIGRSYYYRVRAQNAAGLSEPSNVVGPVKVDYLTLVDEFHNAQQVYQTYGAVALRDDRPRAFKEDFHRLELGPDAWVRYFVPGHIREFAIYVFANEDSVETRIACSPDGRAFRPVGFRLRSFAIHSPDYPYLVPMLIEGGPPEEPGSFLQIQFGQGAQVGRVEIRYE